MSVPAIWALFAMALSVLSVCAMIMIGMMFLAAAGWIIAKIITTVTRLFEKHD